MELFSLENRTVRSKYVKRESTEREPDSSVVPIHRTRGNRKKLKHRRFSLNIRKHFFTVRVTCCYGDCGMYIVGDIGKHGPGKLAADGPD